MPLVGYGVGAWFLTESSGARIEALKDGVTAALDAGFRHIDEAELYGNETHTARRCERWLARTVDEPRRASDHDAR